MTEEERRIELRMNPKVIDELLDFFYSSKKFI